MLKNICILACLVSINLCQAANVTLFDFESKDELKNAKAYNWSSNHTKDFALELSSEYPSNGKNALKLNLPLGGCPGIVLEIEKYNDWSKYKKLKLDIYNEEIYPAIVYVIAVDVKNVETLTAKDEDFPFFSKFIVNEGKNSITMELSKIKEDVDLGKVKELIICVPNRTEIPLLIHIDNIRLE